MMRPMLGLAVLAVSWWLAFRRTPDLESVEHHKQYRFMLMCFAFHAITWWLGWLGLVPA